jgi:hypothetical protein
MRLGRRAVAAAKSSLEALITNDPEHPAIRHFVLVTQAFIQAAERHKGKHDATAISCIKGELEILERRLTSS